MRRGVSSSGWSVLEWIKWSLTTEVEGEVIIFWQTTDLQAYTIWQIMTAAYIRKDTLDENLSRQGENQRVYVWYSENRQKTRLSFKCWNKNQLSNENWSLETSNMVKLQLIKINIAYLKSPQRGWQSVLETTFLRFLFKTSVFNNCIYTSHFQRQHESSIYWKTPVSFIYVDGFVWG